MPEEHAKLSASGSKKWINCPGSVVLERKFPDSTSAYAAEGTAAHALGEAKLKKATNQITRVQYHEMIKGLEITEDMEEYTDSYMDFVIEQYNELKGKYADTVILFEQRLDFSKWVPNGFGTGDTVIIGGGVCKIIDLKYGKGVRVSAQNNSQLRIYGLGAYDAYDYLYGIETFELTIFQPRIDNIDTEILSTKELLTWGRETHQRAILADSEKIICIAGKHCDDGFCKARPICREYAEEKLKLAAKEFKYPAELTTEEIAEVIDQSEHLASWAKLVKEYALEQALSGVKFPGFKVAEGRSNRRYSVPDTEIADKLIGAGYSEKDIYTKELLSITKMETLLSKKKFNELLGGFVEKPQGKPTLVPMEDKRPEWNSAAEDFKNNIEKEI